jgi:hypothetical protein
MNYVILFITILLGLSFMFFAGYAIAFKRFSRYVERARRQMAQQQDTQLTYHQQEVVSKIVNSSQQKPLASSAVTSEYRAQVTVNPAPAQSVPARSRKQGQGL